MYFSSNVDVVIESVRMSFLSSVLRGTLRHFVVIAVISGDSMQPTLRSGDIVLGLRLYPSAWIRRNQVVLIGSLINRSDVFVKRVVGIPGDVIQHEGSIFNSVGHESWLVKNPHGKYEWRVPRNYVFVSGDNSRLSADSFTWGPIPKSFILGLVLKKLQNADNKN